MAKMLTEAQQKWANIISEELHIDANKQADKLAWMSQYAQNHQIYESIQAQGAGHGLYATPLNTLGIGNPMMPQGTGFNAGGDGSGIGNTGADFHAHNYQVGSGDIPMSTLTMALEVAAVTIGLELVPVIPASGPWQMLQYMDFPYAGGKLGRVNETALDGKGENGDNKPIYIKVTGTQKELKALNDKFLADGKTHVNITNEDKAAMHAEYLGQSRIDNGIILKVKKVGTFKADADTAEESVADKDPKDQRSIADVFSKKVTFEGMDLTIETPHADVVATFADHVQEFSNFFGDGKGNGSDEPMTRAQNETGVGNTIGARFFTKMVQMGSYEVTGNVTRQQLQDMPLYGIDVVGKVLEAMQNELSQAINNRILDRVFKLGVTNAVVQHNYQHADLNLYFGNPGDTQSKDLTDFSCWRKFIGIDGKHPDIAKGDWVVPNATKNTAAENVYTQQRRIASRILAAANLIANVSRWGRGNWVVTNTQVLTALQDCSQFIINPMVNNMTQDGSQSLYFAGSIAGLNVYVDPYMNWDDTRVCVGRKSNGQTPGVIFCPYILADQVQIVAEGTMAPKLLTNSRFAIVDFGMHPEQNYLTFMIDTSDDSYII